MNFLSSTQQQQQNTQHKEAHGKIWTLNFNLNENHSVTDLSDQSTTSVILSKFELKIWIRLSVPSSNLLPVSSMNDLSYRWFLDFISNPGKSISSYS